MVLNTKSDLAKAIDFRKKKAACKSAGYDLMTEITVVLLALVLIFTFVFGIHVQRGNDMYPAIKDGDIVFYFRTHNILNTEAVVYSTGGKTYTGRVEAQAGTVISATSDCQMTFDQLYLPISPDDGIYSKTYAGRIDKFPLTVSEDNYFILGDNRDTAEDSRSFGQIPKKNIKGRIITVLRRRQI